PELGLNTDAGEYRASLSAFARELFYLSDNHLALCAILLLPRVWSRTQPATATPAPAESNPATSFLQSIDPPLNGPVCWIEAQEHYIRITTANESRLVLHRFADAIRELPATSGMQVHRSHWVSFADMQALKRNGQRLQLLLHTGNTVPVSRSFRQQVEEKFQTLNGKVRA
ncbi:MAG: LytTR family DNA-binding domain-containing protein, partial [Pseudomonadota bacterium]